MDLKALERLFKLCRKHGLTSYKSTELELSFQEGFEPPKPKAAEADDVAPKGEYNEEDALYWSASN